MPTYVFYIGLALGWLGIALYMIIEPEAVGEATGMVRYGHITSGSPAYMVRFAGCIMLTLVPGCIVGSWASLWWVGVVVAVGLAIPLYIAAGRLDPLDS